MSKSRAHSDIMMILLPGLPEYVVPIAGAGRKAQASVAAKPDDEDAPVVVDDQPRPQGRLVAAAATLLALSSDIWRSPPCCSDIWRSLVLSMSRKYAFCLGIVAMRAAKRSGSFWLNSSNLSISILYFFRFVRFGLLLVLLWSRWQKLHLSPFLQPAPDVAYRQGMHLPAACFVEPTDTSHPLGGNSADT